MTDERAHSLHENTGNHEMAEAGSSKATTSVASGEDAIMSEAPPTMKPNSRYKALLEEFHRNVTVPAEEAAKKSRAYFTSHTSLPDSLKGCEAESALCYPSYLPQDKAQQYPLEPIHSGDNMYRGSDVPDFRLSDSPKAPQCSKHRPAMIIIRDAKGTQTMVQGWPSLSFDAKAHDGVDPRNVHLSFNASTQRPSLLVKIVLDRDATTKHVTKSAWWECSATCVEKTEDSVKIGFSLGNVPKAEDKDPKGKGKASANGNSLDFTGLANLDVCDQAAEMELPAAVQELEKRGKRFTTSFTLRDDNSAIRPRWKGSLTNEQVTKIVDDAKWADLAGANNPNHIDMVSPIERLIIAMHGAKHVSLHREINTESIPFMAKFCTFIRSCFFATAQLGNHWYWRLAAPGCDLEDPSFPLAIIPPPRWMVKNWLVKYVDGKAIECQPTAWDAFNKVFENTFSDSDTAAFEYRLGVAREDHSGNSEFKCLVNEKKLTIKGQFFANAERDTYIVNMHLHGTNIDLDVLRLPAPHENTTIAVSYNHKAIHMIGKIAEDPLGVGSRLSAVVHPRFLADLPLIPNDITLEVNLDLPEDHTPNNRSMNAVMMLQQGQARRFGVCLPEITLGTPRPSDHQIQPLVDTMNDVAYRRYREEIKCHSLNERQLKGARLILSDPHGFLLICGPPRTGKSKLFVAIGCALACAGHKVMISARGNKAVNRDIDEFAAKKPADIHDVAFCRFSSAVSRVHTSVAVAQNTASSKPEPLLTTSSEGSIWASDRDEQLTADLTAGAFDAIKATSSYHDGNAQLGFNEKKLKWIKLLVTMKLSGAYSESDKALPPHARLGPLAAKDHDEFAMAEKYLSLLDTLRQGTGTKASKKSDRKEWNALDGYFSPVYITRVVKVLFVTNSSSANVALLDIWKPTASLQDQASQSAPVDSMVPLAAYKESLVFVAMGGDHKLVQSGLTSTKNNEAYEISREPLITQHMNRKLAGSSIYSHVELSTQY